MRTLVSKSATLLGIAVTQYAEPITGITFDPESKYLMTSSSDKVVHIWHNAPGMQEKVGNRIGNVLLPTLCLPSIGSRTAVPADRRSRNSQGEWGLLLNTSMM